MRTNSGGTATSRIGEPTRGSKLSRRSERTEIPRSILRSRRRRFRLKYSEEIERVDSDCHAKLILP